MSDCIQRITSIRITPMKVTLITLLLAIFYLTYYLGGELRGNINWHFLPGAMFGVPEPLKEKGITPLYLNPGETGWDGQFYYYISNDLLGTPETARHLDAEAYRYQRIGLPLLAKALSLITLQHWVSPITYYFTSLLLILFATYLWASFLQERNYPAWLALFWSLGLGTHLTLLNGLPDAAADSLIVMAIIFHLRRQFVSFTIAVTLAALAREAYVIVPAMMFLVEGYTLIKNKQWSLASIGRALGMYGIPVVIFLSWQIYLRLHFHKSPSSEALGILGFPLASWGEYFVAPIFGWPERVGLVLFIILLFSAIGLTIDTLVKNEKAEPNKELLYVGMAFLPMMLLYTAFGHTVIMHYSGYMKAATILFFVIPMIYVLARRALPQKLYYVMIIISAFFMWRLYSDRVHPQLPSTLFTYAHYTQDEHPPMLSLPCLSSYRSKLAIENIEPFYRNAFFRKLHRAPDARILTVKVTNLSGEEFPMTAAESGGIRLSYQWLDKQGAVIQDGIRSFLREPVPNGKTITAKMIIQLPRKDKGYRLVISLLQEGCSWFYVAGDPGVLNLNASSLVPPLAKKP